MVLIAIQDGDLKGSLRQKDIDRFNAPGSDYFIYLLSTRAGVFFLFR